MVLIFPTDSCDLNPIGTVWGHLRSVLAKVQQRGVTAEPHCLSTGRHFEAHVENCGSPSEASPNAYRSASVILPIAVASGPFIARSAQRRLLTRRMCGMCLGRLCHSTQKKEDPGSRTADFVTTFFPPRSIAGMERKFVAILLSAAFRPLRCRMRQVSQVVLHSADSSNKRNPSIYMAEPLLSSSSLGILGPVISCSILSAPLPP